MVRTAAEPSPRGPDLTSDLEPALALGVQSAPDRCDLAPELRREPPSASALVSRQHAAQPPNLSLHRVLLAKGSSLARAAAGVRTGYGEALRQS